MQQLLLLAKPHSCISTAAQSAQNGVHFVVIHDSSLVCYSDYFVDEACHLISVCAMKSNDVHMVN